MIVKDQRGFFLYRSREGVTGQRRHDPPEAVLRMTVKEPGLSGLDGREGAEDQNP